MSAPSHDGRRVLLHVGLVIAVLGAVVTGFVAHLLGTFRLGHTAEPAAYREAALSVGVVTVVVALLGTGVVLALRPASWVAVLLGVSVAVLAMVALATWGEAGTATPDPDGYHQSIDRGNIGGVLTVAALSPTSWPLLGFALGAAVHVRVRSSRAPRAPRDLSSAPGRPPST